MMFSRARFLSAIVTPVLAIGIGCLGGSDPAFAQSASIAAVVNGQVITNQDVANRSRLFALSTGLPPDPALLARLAPQIRSELIDQTLQLQEIEKDHIAVPEAAIEAAVQNIEKSNGLPPGGLRAKLAAAGINFSTLVNQLRIEIGWTQVLKKALGQDVQPTPQDVAAEKRALQSQIGKTQYHIAEIFIPIDKPADAASAASFAQTVIKQLRAGAPFGIVAAQFSQSQSALQGGDRGFVDPSTLDPAVAKIVTVMPTGAISDPVRVAGGYSIVELLGSRKFGEEQSTILHIRQVFLPFTNKLAPNQQPDTQQLAQLAKANSIRASVHDCAGMTAANQAAGNARPDDPGPVNLATVQPPQFQTLLNSLPLNQASEPLVSGDGVAVVMVCSRAQQTSGLPSDDQIAESLLHRRVNLESQQLMDTLHRQALIDTPT